MTIGYCYMSEFAPEKFHGMIGTVWDISESVVYIILTLYYRYVNKDWHYIIIFASIEQLISILLIIIYIPESPKWLYDQKRYTECYNAI
jgi:hypothetical protein